MSNETDKNYYCCEDGVCISIIRIQETLVGLRLINDSDNYLDNGHCRLASSKICKILTESK